MAPMGGGGLSLRVKVCGIEEGSVAMGTDL